MKEAESSTDIESRPDQDVLPDSIQFCSIEEMQEASIADGWSVEFRQLQAGDLKTHAVEGQCASISTLDEYTSHRLDVAGLSPDGHVAVLIPVGRARLWASGNWVDDQTTFMLNSGSDIHFVTDPNARIFSMHVPISILDEAGCSLFEDWGGLGSAHHKIIGSRVTTTQRIRMLIAATMHDPVPGRWQKERECNLASNLAMLINGSTDHSERHRHTPRCDPVNTLRLSIEFINAHLSEPFSIGEMCNYAAASIRKVQRLFQRELGLTPSQYVTARRLAAARRELKYCTPEETHVADIALKYGFYHVGRFSGLFRTQYGELPSHTLLSK